jgi:hypothetical protein
MSQLMAYGGVEPYDYLTTAIRATKDVHFLHVGILPTLVNKPIDNCPHTDAVQFQSMVVIVA